MYHHHHLHQYHHHYHYVDKQCRPRHWKCVLQKLLIIIIIVVIIIVITITTTNGVNIIIIVVIIYSTILLVRLVHAVSMTGADRKVKQTKLVDRLNFFCCFSLCKCIASYSSWPVLLSVLLLFPVAVHSSTPSPLSVTVWV